MNSNFSRSQNLVAKSWNQSPPLPLQSLSANHHQSTRGGGKRQRETEEKKKREGEREGKRRSGSNTTGQRNNLTTEGGRKRGELREQTSVSPDIADISIHSGGNFTQS